MAGVFLLNSKDKTPCLKMATRTVFFYIFFWTERALGIFFAWGLNASLNAMACEGVDGIDISNGHRVAATKAEHLRQQQEDAKVCRVLKQK